MALPAAGSAPRRALGLFDGQFAILRPGRSPEDGRRVLRRVAHFSATYAALRRRSRVSRRSLAEADVPMAWTQWTVEGLDAGSVSPARDEHDVTAPCIKPRTFTVLFSIGLAGVPGLTTPYPNGRAPVSVYARNWQLTMEQKRTGLCPTGFLMNWTSRAVDQYSVQDGGGAVAGLGRVDGNGIFNAGGSCLSQLGCTWDFADDWPLLTIDEVTGLLDRQSGGMVFTVSYTEEAKTPIHRHVQRALEQPRPDAAGARTPPETLSWDPPAGPAAYPTTTTTTSGGRSRRSAPASENP